MLINVCGSLWDIRLLIYKERKIRKLYINFLLVLYFENISKIHPSLISSEDFTEIDNFDDILYLASAEYNFNTDNILYLHALMHPQRVCYTFDFRDCRCKRRGSGQHSSRGENRCVHQQVGVCETRKACSHNASAFAHITSYSNWTRYSVLKLLAVWVTKMLTDTIFISG